MSVAVQTHGTAAEAAAALSADRSARYLGGGTLVMRALNEGDGSIGALVRSTDPGLRRIRPTGARIEIGAGVTMAEVLASADLSALHGAARAVGGPAIRTMATVGGNLFAPAPYGDFATALLALDASVRLAGDGRETPLSELLARRERGSVGLVAAVSIERPAPGAFRFRKVSRVKPKGISVLSIAALLPLSGGAVRGARLAYGAMAPTPMRASAAERALEGRRLDEAGVGDAVRAAAEGTSPADDAIASAWYRREVVGAHLKRLLLETA